MDRRKLLSLAVKGAGLAVVGLVSVPALIKSLSPVLEPEPEEQWLPLGRIAEFPVGAVKKAVVPVEAAAGPQLVDKKSVYVWRSAADAFVVYSRACTDLGCPITWDPGSEWFYCPCHGGIFSKNGLPQAGPPPRPLWRYDTRVRDGVLEINLRSVPPMA